MSKHETANDVQQVEMEESLCAAYVESQCFSCGGKDEIGQLEKFSTDPVNIILYEKFTGRQVSFSQNFYFLSSNQRMSQKL